MNKRKKKAACLNCGKEVHRVSSSYCSIKCQHVFSWKKLVETIEKEGLFPERTQLNIHRRYLIEKNGKRCSICGLENWNGKPIPLTVDHIDGYHTNRKIENFRLICCNCDAQLPTYKGKNRGKGNSLRRKRYVEGKTF